MKTISSCPGYIRGTTLAPTWKASVGCWKPSGAFHASYISISRRIFSTSNQFPSVFHPRKNWNTWASGDLRVTRTHDFGMKSFIEKVARRSTSTCVKYYVLELRWEFSFRLRLLVSIFEKCVRLFWRWNDIELDTLSSIFGELIAKSGNFIYFLFEIIFKKSYIYTKVFFIF